MDLPDVQLLCLEQKDLSLEDHTRYFLDLAYLTHYPDSCLCTFYYVELNTLTKAKLSGEDHQGSFAAYVEQETLSLQRVTSQSKCLPEHLTRCVFPVYIVCSCGTTCGV